MRELGVRGEQVRRNQRGKSFTTDDSTLAYLRAASNLVPTLSINGPDWIPSPESPRVQMHRFDPPPLISSPALLITLRFRDYSGPARVSLRGSSENAGSVSERTSGYVRPNRRLIVTTGPGFLVVSLTPRKQFRPAPSICRASICEDGRWKGLIFGRKV